MLPESQLQFLNAKVQELQSALFFNLGSSVLKMPTMLVNAMQVDEVGNIWFYIHRPVQYLQEFDREFPARLEFFRKGKSYYLKVNGKACIVNDPEELNSLPQSPDAGPDASNMVLVKLRMQHADYFETPNMEPSWLKYVTDAVKKWLFNIQPGYKPYTIEHGTMISY